MPNTTLKILCLAAGAALLLPSSAKAAFELVVTTSSGSTLVPMSSSSSYSLNNGGFSGTVAAATNDPAAGASSGYITFATLNLTNNNPGQASIELLLGDTGFTGPNTNTYNPGTVTLYQSGGGEVTGSSLLSISMQSFADPYNGQNTTSGLNVASVSSTGISWSNSSDFTLLQNPAQATLTKEQLDYSLTNVLNIELSSGTNINMSQLNYNGTTQTSGPFTKTIPEPASLALLAVGGLGLLLKRRRKKVES